jgi:hypothetical protein
MNDPQSREYLGTQPHFQNLLLGGGVALFGAFLAFSGPLLGFTIRWRRLPPSILVFAGYAILALGIAALVFLAKTQLKCLRCNQGLEEGEAAFPEDSADAVLPLVRGNSPAGLMEAPVGSRFGTGPHVMFDYCPGCKSVGLLSLHRHNRRDGESAYEIEKRLVTGDPAQKWAHICELHDRVRTANNAGA